MALGKRHLSATIILLLISISIQAQFFSGTNYAVESQANSGAGEYAPFWLSANKYGLSSIQPIKNGYLRAGLFKSYEEDKTFSYAYGLDLVSTYNFDSRFIVQQAYLDLKYRAIAISVGSKERELELKNSFLSSGGMVFSRNARPIPQVRIEIPDYLPLGSINSLFAIKGHLAYGAYTDNSWQKDFTAKKTKYTENALYHSKALFLKIGNENRFPVVFEGGLEMAAQFGGKIYNIGHKPYLDNSNGFIDFVNVLISSGGDVTDGEKPNVYGNQLGSWNVSLSYQFPAWKVRGYLEHYFEDHSMIVDEYAWKKYADGGWKESTFSWIPPIIPSAYYWKDFLAGIEIEFPKNPFISTLVYEHLATKEQSGVINHDSTAEIPDQISAADNYYNHSNYTGWQHWGMAVGNPFLLSPIYNKDGRIQFKSNRVRAHHVGVSGNPTSEIAYRLLLSRTENWGTYGNPFVDVRENKSFFFEICYSPKFLDGWTATGAFAFDRGDMMGNNKGGMVSVRKTGLLMK